MLKRLHRETRREQIIEEIKRLIVEGELKPGDRIATEQELADGMGVSRTSVREAVKALELIGVLKSSPKSGCVVGELGMQAVVDQLSFHLLTRATRMGELVEARVALEVCILPIVAKRITPEEYKTLEALARSMEATLATGRDIIDLDIEFHRTLFAATRNEVLEGFGIITKEFFTGFQRHCGGRAVKPNENSITEHWAIIRALQQGNIEEAQSVMQKHLSRWGEATNQLAEDATLRQISLPAEEE